MRPGLGEQAMTAERPREATCQGDTPIPRSGPATYWRQIPEAYRTVPNLAAGGATAANSGQMHTVPPTSTNRR